MTTIIKVKHRILLRKGDYTAEASDGGVVMTFESKSVARSTFISMKNAPVKMEVIYNEDKQIVQYLKGKKEKEIVEKIVEELEEAKKHLYPSQRLSYIIEKS
jgi:hypothetical protein